MARAFSKDLRERIVNAYNSGVGTISQVANLFEVSKESVNKYLRLHRANNDLTPGKSTGRPPFLTDTRLKIIKNIILKTPDARLVDHCLQFETETGRSIPKSTMWDAYNILNMRRKKKPVCRRAK